MLWLASQVFLLCLLAFLAGAGLTYLALRRGPAALEPAVAETVRDETAGHKTAG